MRGPSLRGPRDGPRQRDQGGCPASALDIPDEVADKPLVSARVRAVHSKPSIQPCSRWKPPAADDEGKGRCIRTMASGRGSSPNRWGIDHEKEQEELFEHVAGGRPVLPHCPASPR